MKKMKTITGLSALLGMASSATAALTSGLVTYYDFEDLNNDASASGPNATIVGTDVAVGQTGGAVGNAATFAGTTNDRISTSVGFGSGNTLGESFTVAAWYKLDTDATSAASRFFVFEAENNFDLSYGLRNLDAGLADGQTYAGSTPNNLFTDVHTAGTWQHVLITYTANAGTTTVETYINGSALDSITATTSTISSTGIHIGNARSSSGTRAFDGMIDEFAAWNRVLDSSEISQVYQNGVNGQAVTAIPEPSVTTLIGLGGLSLILRRRR
ncbi:LamG-like jellyroll fold domain-containing protein [Rubritalea tangerina]|uniref:LamG-like jellyroll fold domain-containing protein n=1 Tax=Rubritalea tangerina TaxID=430798 RepID=A0ABW4ZAP3_9BACT